MNKLILLLMILVMIVSFASCRSADTSDDTSLQNTDNPGVSITDDTTLPSATTETENPSEATAYTETTGFLIPGDVNQEDLTEFNDLFQNFGWHNSALSQQYAAVEEMKLILFLGCGFEGESDSPTDGEWEELKDEVGFDINLDLCRLPVQLMNDVLTDCFDLTLANFSDACFEGMLYLESTDCWYSCSKIVTSVNQFQAVYVERLDDNIIRVFYTCENYDDVHVVTLAAKADSYVIMSNLPASE